MWINITTGKVCLTLSGIRQDSPNTSFPQDLTDAVILGAGYQPVTKTSWGFNPLTERAVELAPIEIDGVWTQQWETAQLFETQDERDAAIALDRASKAAVKVEAIKAERDRRKFNGVKVGTKWIHTDTYSRTQWMGMVMMGASIPAIDWTTMDGTSVTTSQALAGSVFQGTAQLDAALFGYAKTLITQVEAAADPASVDITVGWPATFEPA